MPMVPSTRQHHGHQIQDQDPKPNSNSNVNAPPSSPPAHRCAIHSNSSFASGANASPSESIPHSNNRGHDTALRRPVGQIVIFKSTQGSRSSVRGPPCQPSQFPRRAPNTPTRRILPPSARALAEAGAEDTSHGSPMVPR